MRKTNIGSYNLHKASKIPVENMARPERSSTELRDCITCIEPSFGYGGGLNRW